VDVSNLAFKFALAPGVMIVPESGTPFDFSGFGQKYVLAWQDTQTLVNKTVEILVSVRRRDAVEAEGLTRKMFFATDFTEDDLEVSKDAEGTTKATLSVRFDKTVNSTLLNPDAVEPVI
jgi:hypothetical protein